jgi:hypothetical protein
LIHNYNSGIELNLFQYPNPIIEENTYKIFTIDVFKPDSTISFELRFVNQQFTKVNSFNHIQNTFHFSFDLIETNNNELIRAYYMFTRNDTCFHKGFGDIIFE